MLRNVVRPSNLVGRTPDQTNSLLGSKVMRTRGNKGSTRGQLLRNA